MTLSIHKENRNGSKSEFTWFQPRGISGPTVFAGYGGVQEEPKGRSRVNELKVTVCNLFFFEEEL